MPPSKKTNMSIKLTLVTIILGLSIFAFYNLIPAVYANPCTENPCPVVFSHGVSVGGNNIYFRNIHSTDNSTITVSLDKSQYLVGQTATLTIKDFNENVNPFA